MMDPTNHEVSEARRTQLGLYVTSAEAAGILAADDDAKLLDVRTPHEYVFVGHAEEAVNIPLAGSVALSLATSGSAKLTG